MTFFFCVQCANFSSMCMWRDFNETNFDQMFFFFKYCITIRQNGLLQNRISVWVEGFFMNVILQTRDWLNDNRQTTNANVYSNSFCALPRMCCNLVEFLLEIHKLWKMNAFLHRRITVRQYEKYAMMHLYQTINCAFVSLGNAKGPTIRAIMIVWWANQLK